MVETAAEHFLGERLIRGGSLAGPSLPCACCYAEHLLTTGLSEERKSSIFSLQGPSSTALADVQFPAGDGRFFLEEISDASCCCMRQDWLGK